ncbi:hypothetical protein CLCR_07782 [Cladophialophora carrionii]|uniref:Uncharacterized protein n=1 Tax=Cladophialophora carrionii TaxID=86049 RepID=A0A1C1CMF2_9EURO|nr:hypothetical protein CLCR_07782 [Cladophialophora carrionii]
MPTEAGDSSFSKARLRAVWNDPENGRRRGEYELHSLINHDSEHGLPNTAQAKRLCLKLYEDTADPQLHVTQLDKSYSDTYWLGNLGMAVAVEQQACSPFSFCNDHGTE